MRDFRALKVWQRAHRLAIQINVALARVRRRGFAHIVTQGQRSSLSVPTNIVEGCGHDSDKDFVRYLRTSLASANETEYHLLCAADLELIPRELHAALEAETQAVKRMLYALIGRTGRGGG